MCGACETGLLWPDLASLCMLKVDYVSDIPTEDEAHI
jgi:hypothetical protein